MPGIVEGSYYIKSKEATFVTCTSSVADEFYHSFYGVSCRFTLSEPILFGGMQFEETRKWFNLSMTNFSRHLPGTDNRLIPRYPDTE